MNRKSIPDSLKKQIAKLADSKFITKVLTEQLPNFYPDFKKLAKLKIIPHKKHIGKTSAVFVIEYQLSYFAAAKQEKPLRLFATGHSDGSRRSAYDKLNLLFNNGFGDGQYTVTKPLFFLDEQQGFFYEASPGRSLYHWFSKDPQADLTNALQLSAGWIRKLHNLSIKERFAFPQFAIANMIPAPDKFLADFRKSNPELGDWVSEMVNTMQTWEAKFNQEHDLGLIYGDYHPENVIVDGLQAKGLKMIDFTDVALGDPMIDLGTFLEQFYFMSQAYMTPAKVKAYKEYFLANYFNQELKDLPSHYFQRINLYQAWTAMRTAVFIFYQNKPNSVNDVLGDAEKYLKLLTEAKKQISLHHHEA